MQTITVNLNPPYPIHLGSDLLLSNALIQTCQQLSKNWVIIADKNIINNYATPLKNHLKKSNLKTLLIEYDANETNKTREAKTIIEDQLLKANIGRDSGILAIGGGITLDIAGFIAATYMRGIPTIYFPTTLLAMTDASIGGKTAVNTTHGKNLIGAFHQPKAVFIDLNTLVTLDQNEMLMGLSEIIKHAIIKDEALFDLLENNFDKFMTKDVDFLETILEKSLKIKKIIVEQDEFDHEIRQILNFGHTIGHALEAASDFKMPHGEAVALGIICESHIALQMGILNKTDFSRIKNIFKTYPYQFSLEKYSLKIEAIEAALVKDKKTLDRIPQFILIEGIGKIFVEGGVFTHSVEGKFIQNSIQDLLTNSLF